MPDGPIGTRESRAKKALYWHWTKDMTQAEIGDKLGVSARKVREYVSEAPTSPAVQNSLDTLESEVRFVAVEKLRQQLVEAGERAQSAEKPVEIWEDESGNIQVADIHDVDRQVVDRNAVPADFELGVDEKGRFFSRQEAREILDLLTDIVGAKAADRQEIELSGAVETDTSLSDEDRDWLDGRFGDSGDSSESE